MGPFDGRFITTSAIDQADILAEVLVTPEQCGPESGYGLVFRYVDLNNHYILTIFCNNTYVITGRAGGRLIGGETAPLPNGVNASDPVQHKLSILTTSSTFYIFL